MTIGGKAWSKTSLINMKLVRYARVSVSRLAEKKCHVIYGSAHVILAHAHLIIAHIRDHYAREHGPRARDHCSVATDYRLIPRSSGQGMAKIAILKLVKTLYMYIFSESL